MSSIVMYTTAVCPYCQMAERLLQRKGVSAVHKIRVDLDPQQRQVMQQRSGRRTVPQIFIAHTHVGGYEDLVALDRAGQLDPLLASAGEVAGSAGA